MLFNWNKQEMLLKIFHHKSSTEKNIFTDIIRKSLYKNFSFLQNQQKYKYE